MLSKNQVKIINSLKHKKFRQKYDLFVVEGLKMVQTLLQSDKYKINSIFYTENLPNFLKTHHETKMVSIDERMMKTISFLNNPSTILALVETKNGQVKIIDKAIYLDGVQDPGNVGTIIRIADWFGIDTVIRSEDAADFYNPKVIQSSMGAIANVNLSQMTREELLAIKNKILLAADMDGEDINSIAITSSFVLIMGSEGKGLHPLFKNDKVQKISILGNNKKISESLNVSVATGIITSKLLK